MRRLVDIETKEEFAELSEILAKVRNAHAVGTIKQAALKENGEYSYIDLQQDVTETRTILQIEGSYFYVTIENIRRNSVRKMKTMWNTVLQRGTQQFEKGKANDYLFTIDIVHNELEKGLVYSVSAVQPIFVSSDGDTDLKFVFPLDCARCSKDEVSMYDIEYEEAIREESGNDVYNFKNEDEDDEESNEESAEESEDFISNDKYTEI